MFDTAYFNVSPFGPDDPTAQTTKLLSGNNFFSSSSGISQDNPWLTTTQTPGQVYGENGYFGDTEAPQQSWTDYGKSQGYSGDVYQFGDGKAIPVEFLYGYNRFGIGEGNRNTLYQMVNWDQYKNIPGLKSPDEFAADAFLQHWNTNQHGYTDDESSSGSSVLKGIANQFLNQDYFKNLRGGSEFDITQAPAWTQFSQADAERMGTAKAATQHENAGSGAIISRGLQNFIQSSLMTWLGTGGWGEIGSALGGAETAGAASSATTTGGSGMDWDMATDGYDFGGGGAGFSGSDALEQYDWGSAGNTGGNSGYLGSTPLDSSGNWAGAGGTGGWQQTLQQAMKGYGQMNGGGGNNQNGGYSLPLGQLLAGLMGMYGANKQAGTANDLMNRAAGAADPFASQRGFYADQLKQSYTDPTKLWDSPGWQGLRERMLRESTAKDAAGGRLTDFGNRDQMVAEKFLGDYLPKMQQGLMQPSGASGNPAAVAQALMSMSGQVGQAQNNQSNALGYLLNSLFTGNQPSTVDRFFGGAPAQNDNLLNSLMKWYQSKTPEYNTNL